MTDVYFKLVEINNLSWIVEELALSRYGIVTFRKS